MEKKKEIRLLRANEIECRVSTVSEKGASLLLYKDARVDQNILDEVFGIFGWQRIHEQIGDSLFCTVMVKDENGAWISKQDVGTSSFAEPVKGAASDSFKRACFNLGIGRELYSAPFIWVPADRVNISNVNGKYIVKDKFIVSNIEYDEERGGIVTLEIKNGRDEVVYSHHKFADTANLSDNENKIGKWQEKKLREEMARTGVSEKAICERYGIKQIADMNENVFKRVMEALGKTQDLAA